MRLVLDTTTLVAAIRSAEGPSRELLLAALQSRFQVLISVPLVVEYEAVMSRPEHLKVAGLSKQDLAVLLDAIVAVAEPVYMNFLWRPTLGDPDDEMVLEAAVNGLADAIVTFNRRDFAIADSQFGISVWSPGEALQRVRERS